LFRGTVNQTAVYPREVIKKALQLNACAMIFAHNHPSGCAEPSRADQVLTQAIKNAAGLVDISVLDHLIIAGDVHYSFAQHGLA
jgi:DNA repair protein RadC